MGSNRGVTLIELMVTVAIIAILAGLAAPSFVRLIASNALATQANSLLADVRLARSEAIKRGHSVTLCPTGNASNLDSCSGNDWKAGWIVFADTDSNNAKGAGETILRRQESFTNSAGITGSSISSIRFNADGRVPGGAANLTFNAINDAAPSRAICIAITGRARVASSC